MKITFPFYSLLITVALVLGLIPGLVAAADLTFSGVTTTYNAATQNLKVSGTTSGTDDVAINVIDSNGTIRLFAAASVVGGAFSYDSAASDNPGGPIKISLPGGSYKIRLADYAGGAYTSFVLTVPGGTIDSPVITTATAAPAMPNTGNNPSANNAPWVIIISGVIAASLLLLYTTLNKKRI